MKKIITLLFGIGMVSNLVLSQNHFTHDYLVNDVVDAIVQAIDIKDNEGKIYEIGGPTVISFGDMVKSILKTINKKRLVVPMPMPIAKIQSTITDLLPFPPILTKPGWRLFNLNAVPLGSRTVAFNDSKIIL